MKHIAADNTKHFPVDSVWQKHCADMDRRSNQPIIECRSCGSPFIATNGCDVCGDENFGEEPNE